MAIQYAGGTRVNYTFTDAGTRADLVSKLETQLGTVGWSTISGAGTGDVLMKSAVTPDGLSIRLRLYDPGSGNCAQFTMKNNANTLTSQVIYLLPASVNWRIVANKYGLAMLKSGAAYRAVGRAALFCGTIWVPDYVLNVMGVDLDCGYIIGGGTSDTDTGNYATWRNHPLFATSGVRATTLFRSFLLNQSASYGSGLPRLSLASMQGDAAGMVAWEWEGGPRHGREAVISWSPDNTTTTRPKIKGQVWDGLILSGKFDGEVIRTFDGHSFITITDQCDEVVTGIGTLCLATD